jgi:hypothetical protein
MCPKTNSRMVNNDRLYSTLASPSLWQKIVGSGLCSPGVELRNREETKCEFESTDMIVVNVFGGETPPQYHLVEEGPEGGRMMATLCVKTQQTAPAVVPQQLLTMRHVDRVRAQHAASRVLELQQKWQPRQRVFWHSYLRKWICESERYERDEAKCWLAVPCPFISGLFNDTVTKSDYIALKNWMVVNW